MATIKKRTHSEMPARQKKGETSKNHRIFLIGRDPSGSQSPTFK